MNETDEQINFEMFDQKSADEKDDCSDTIKGCKTTELDDGSFRGSSLQH